MSKHMSLEDRQKIEAALNRHESLSQIGESIGKNRTTIAREIMVHRTVWDHPPFGRIQNRCLYRFECSEKHLCGLTCNRKCSTCAQCNKLCSRYTEEHCTTLDKPPYVCNGCPDHNKCPIEKFHYDPVLAQKEYRFTLKDAREGFNLSEQELQNIDSLISPLLCNGQSIHHAALACKDQLFVGDRTLYRLTDKSALKARNIDLPRKCKLKRRKGIKPKRKLDKNCRVGRTYTDYCTYMTSHPGTLSVQMDSVIGCVNSSKVLLTLWFPGDFMPVFLRASNTSSSVLEWIEFLYEGLGHDDFCKLFPVILTDNGTEFSNPSAIETAPDGRQRTKVFYCDPMASYQKPNVECCHEMFRRILPKGTSFDNLTQSDVAVAASHVNSYARNSLNDKTPMDALAFHYGTDLAEKLLRLLCLTRIEPKNIILRPDLLKH